MIPDSKTNFLYLADTLPKFYPKFFAQFEAILNQSKITFELLSNSKDVWAVDYMPIQVDENKYIQFVYNPSYLQTKIFLKTISDVDTICESIGIKTEKSKIVIDGGNVVKSTNSVILTERIYKENPTIERKQLLKELQEQLLVDRLVIIPEQPYDFTGHSDGMVRFIDDNTVLINDYKNENKRFAVCFEDTLKQSGLNIIRIPYNPYNNSMNMHAMGIYINYLQMDRAVVIPIFNQKEDDFVVKQFEQLFLGYDITTVDGTDIAKQGGLLNCISWNIYK
jgi:agmatine deiminase